MMLSAPERLRLKILIGTERLGRLTAVQEREMRQLIAKEFPDEARSLERDMLVRLGLGMMAAWHLFPEQFKDEVEEHA